MKYNRCLLQFCIVAVGVNVLTLNFVCWTTCRINILKYGGSTLATDDSRVNMNKLLLHIKTLSNQTGLKKPTFRVLTNRVENNTIRYGYALGWDYYEEQTCAARNLVGLQRWATSLNINIVEPFVWRSFF